jgi:hypothetical protein
MKRGLKAKWMRNLLSGEYKQATGNLKKGNKHCCLGVLADIQGAKWEHSVGFSTKCILKGRDVARSGVLTRGASGLSEATQQTLAHMNDSGYTFKQIANWIKKNVRVAP